MKEKILGLIQKGELDKAAKLTASSYKDSDSKFFMIRLNIIIKYGDKNSRTYYLMLNRLASDMVRFIEEEEVEEEIRNCFDYNFERAIEEAQQYLTSEQKEWLKECHSYATFNWFNDQGTETFVGDVFGDKTELCVTLQERKVTEKTCAVVYKFYCN
jgi:hypothetical protein